MLQLLLSLSCKYSSHRKDRNCWKSADFLFVCWKAALSTGCNWSFLATFHSLPNFNSGIQVGNKKTCPAWGSQFYFTSFLFYLIFFCFVAIGWSRTWWFQLGAFPVTLKLFSEVWFCEASYWHSVLSFYWGQVISGQAGNTAALVWEETSTTLKMYLTQHGKPNRCTHINAYTLDYYILFMPSHLQKNNRMSLIKSLHCITRLKVIH